MRRLALVLALLCLAVPIVADESLAPADCLAQLEQICLGATPAGSMSDRLTCLENLIWGHTGQGTLLERLIVLRDTVLDNGSRVPSLVFRLNVIEWQLYHSVTNRPLQEKMSGLERTIGGQPVAGTFLARLDSLSASIWPGGRLQTTRIDLTARTLVKIKLLADLSSSANKIGDTFPFAVSETVYQDGMVALPQGSMGQGRIAHIKPPANMGRDAQITMVFGPVAALDGTSVQIAAGDESIEANKSQSFTVRVTAAGMIVLGPAGILSGLFVHGKETILPCGTGFYVQTIAVTPCLTLAKGDQ